MKSRKCSVCGIATIATYHWSQGVRPEGSAEYGGRGMCRTHYQRFMRHGSTESQAKPPPQERRGQTRRDNDQVLADWSTIRHDVGSLNEAAPKLGMTVSALDKVLYRARKAGDTRGNVPFSPHIRRSS